MQHDENLKILDKPTTIQPQDVTVSAFEAWISRVEGIQERVRNFFQVGEFVLTNLELLKAGNR